MARHVHMLELIAAKVGQRFPPCIEADDLRQAGAFGLADAIEKFNPGRGVKFSTYAPQRIHGAMIDWVRSIDWVPRLARTRAKSGGRIIGMSSIDQPDPDADRPRVKLLSDERVPTEAKRREEEQHFAHVVKALPAGVHRTVITLRYVETMTHREIGEVLGLSESRISQIFTESIDILKATLPPPEVGE